MYEGNQFVLFETSFAQHNPFKIYPCCRVYQYYLFRIQCSTFHLSSPLSVDIWDVSSSGLLWIKFLLALLNKSFSGHKFHFSWINAKEELLGKRVGVYLTSQKSAKSFPKVVITFIIFTKQCLKALAFPHSSQYLASLY